MVQFKTGVFWAMQRKNALPAYNWEFIANTFCSSRVIYYAGMFPETLEKRKNRKNRLQFQFFLPIRDKR
jgi:hypothetical protein